MELAMNKNDYQRLLMDKWWTLIEATRHIYTKTGDGELCYVAERASKAKQIVEIGTLFGRSAKMMLLANPTAKVWCVDIFVQDGTYECAQYFLKDEIDAARCEILKMPSDMAGPFLNDTQIDLVFCDDGHEKADVLRDISSFYHLLRNGGTICGHDLDRNPDNGVTQAVKERFGHQWTEPVPRIWEHIKPYMG